MIHDIRSSSNATGACPITDRLLVFFFPSSWNLEKDQKDTDFDHTENGGFLHTHGGEGENHYWVFWSELCALDRSLKCVYLFSKFLRVLSVVNHCCFVDTDVKMFYETVERRVGWLD